MPTRYVLVGVPARLGDPAPRWAFNTAGCPVRLATDPSGLSGSSRAHSYVSNAHQPGGTWRGIVEEVATITLDTLFGPVPPGPRAVAEYTRWRSSLGTGREALEFHVHGASGHRWQPVRLASTLPSPQYTAVEVNGAAGDGQTPEVVELNGDTAYWRAADVVCTRTAAQLAADPLVLENASDVDVWPSYDLVGPGVFDIGTAGEHHKVTVPAGQTWTVDTDSDYPRIVDQTGTDRWNSVGVVAWHEPVPARDAAFRPHIAVTGAAADTAVRVTLPQRFLAAQ